MSAAELAAARRPFEAAADAFLALLGDLPPEGWDGPGLGEWNLRALVGHTSRSFLTLTRAATEPAAKESAGSPGEYFAVVSGATGFELDGAALVQRGVDAGRALGEHPADAVRRQADEARSALDDLDGDDPVGTTAVGGMRISQYLPTRTFELTVHGLDVAAALGVPFEPPVEALTACLAVATEAAVLRGDGALLLRTLTGRAELGPSYSVVP